MAPTFNNTGTYIQTMNNKQKRHLPSSLPFFRASLSACSVCFLFTGLWLCGMMSTQFLFDSEGRKLECFSCYVILKMQVIVITAE